MAKKEFRYKGKTLEELQKMSVKELAEIFPAPQRRKIKRGFKDSEKILLKAIDKKKKNLETHCRDMIILPNMVGIIIKIHNGKEFVPIQIKEEMIAHRLGEFALTRKSIKHSAPGIGATRSSASLSVR